MKQPKTETTQLAMTTGTVDERRMDVEKITRGGKTSYVFHVQTMKEADAVSFLVALRAAGWAHEAAFAAAAVGLTLPPQKGA